MIDKTYWRLNYCLLIELLIYWCEIMGQASPVVMYHRRGPKNATGSVDNFNILPKKRKY